MAVIILGPRSLAGFTFENQEEEVRGRKEEKERKKGKKTYSNMQCLAAGGKA